MPADIERKCIYIRRTPPIPGVCGAERLELWACDNGDIMLVRVDEDEGPDGMVIENLDSDAVKTIVEAASTRWANVRSIL